MKKLAILVWAALSAGLALALFDIKHRVQGLEGELARAHAEVLRDQEAIRILKAEWSYLNRPSRISDLARRHLALEPLSSQQFVRLEDLPVRQSPHADVGLELPTMAPAGVPKLTSARSTQ